MGVDTAAEQQPRFSKRQALKLLGLSGIAAALGIFALPKQPQSQEEELIRQGTEEQKEAERFLQGRSLKSFVVTDEGSGDLRSSRGLAIRDTSYIKDPKTPSGIIDRLPEGTRVKGVIWRTDYNPKDPGQEREWAVIKYERGNQKIVGFATTRYLKEMKPETNYSR